MLVSKAVSKGVTTPLNSLIRAIQLDSTILHTSSNISFNHLEQLISRPSHLNEYKPMLIVPMLRRPHQVAFAPQTK